MRPFSLSCIESAREGRLSAVSEFARPQNFQYDQRNRRFYLSSILSWFGEDFGSSQAAQLRKIAQWLPTDGARQAAMQNAVSVGFLDYN